MPDQLEQYSSNRNGVDVSGLNLLDLIKPDSSKAIKPSSADRDALPFFVRAGDEKTDPKGDTTPKTADSTQKPADGPQPVKAAPPVGNADVVFLHFNDMHSTGILNGDVATMTQTMKDRIDLAHKDGKFVVVVFGGDEAGGNTVSSLGGKGLIENQVLQKMKELTGQEIYQVIGNHAADGAKDVKNLVGVAETTNAQFSVSNLEFPGAPEAIGPGKNFQPFRVAEAKHPDGRTVKVGIIGLTTVEYSAEAKGVRLKYQTLVGLNAAEIAQVAKDLNKALETNGTNPKQALPVFDNQGDKTKKDPYEKFRTMTAEEIKLRAAEYNQFINRSNGQQKIGFSEGKTFSINDAYIHAACDTVAEMKSQGIEKIVIASHLGLAVDLEVAKHVPGVSLIIGAHSHDAVAIPNAVKNVHTGSEVAVVQAGCKAQFLGETEVSYKGKTSQEYEVKGTLHDIDKIKQSKAAPGELSTKMTDFIGNLRQNGDPKMPPLKRTMDDLATSKKFGTANPDAPLKATGTYTDANLRKGESCLGNLTSDSLRCALDDYQRKAATPGQPAPPRLNAFLNHMGGVRNGIGDGAALDGVKLCDVFCTGNSAGELVITKMTPKMLKDVLEFGVHDLPLPGKSATHDYSGNFLSPSGVKVEFDSTSERAKYVKADETDAVSEKSGKSITKISILNPETNKYEVIWDASTMTPEELNSNKRELRIGTRAHAIEKWAKNGVFSDPASYPEFQKAKEAAEKQLIAQGDTKPSIKQIHELAGFKLLGVDKDVKLVDGAWVSKIDVTQPEALGKYLNGQTEVAPDILFEKPNGKIEIKPEKVGGLDGRFVDVKAAAPAPVNAKPAATPNLTDGVLRKAQPELVKLAVTVDEPRHEKAPNPTVKDVKASPLLPDLTIVGDDTVKKPAEVKAAETKSNETAEREKVERAAKQTETRKLARKGSSENLDHFFAGKGMEVVNAEGKVIVVVGIRQPLGKGEVSYLVPGENGLEVDEKLTQTVKERVRLHNDTLNEMLKDPNTNKAVDVLHRYAQVSQDVSDSFGLDTAGQLIDYRAVAQTAQKTLGAKATVDGTTVRFQSEAGIPMVVKFKPEQGKKADIRSWSENELTDEKMAKLLEVIKVEDRVIKEQLETAMKELLKKNNIEAKDFEACQKLLAKEIREGRMSEVTKELREVFKSFGVEFEGGKPKFENGQLVLRPKTVEGADNKAHGGPSAFEKCKGKAVPIMMLVLAVSHQSQDRPGSGVIKK